MLHEPSRVTAKAYTSRILAGPLGFYGCAFGIAIGACRESRDLAVDDLERGEDLIVLGGFAGAAHAWREMNKTETGT